jgi:3D (Asp-Asp-Asp) domain-containing protein
MKRRLLEISLIFLAVLGLVIYIVKDNNKFKLLRAMINKPLTQVIEEYSSQSCLVFTPQEQKQGYFEALVTGYCRPRATSYTKRQDFLCAVGLNCSCPSGRSKDLSCGDKGLTWAPCLDFNESQIAYCNQTATFSQPAPGTVAADWNCFQPNSHINIADKKYLVADKGSAIKGRRFDLWLDDCQQALNIIGIYQVKIPNH